MSACEPLPYDKFCGPYIKLELEHDSVQIISRSDQ